MTTKNVVFIDSRVAGYETLIAGLSADTEWYLLDANQDGIDQMQRILASYSELDSVQVISHGSTGTLYLGSTVLNGDNLYSYQTQLQAIGSSLTTTGDILLYGCNVAQGDIGVSFVNSLAQITRADVAASDDVTGLGGDWVLEQKTGSIESKFTDTLVAVQDVANLDYQQQEILVGNGVLISDFGYSEQASWVAYQDDGKLLVVGDSRQGTNGYVLLVRYNQDGSLDNSFGASGVTYISHSLIFPRVTYSQNNVYGDRVEVESNGGILISGHYQNNYSGSFLVKLTSNGLVDISFNNVGYLKNPSPSESIEFFSTIVGGNQQVFGDSFFAVSGTTLSRSNLQGVTDLEVSLDQSFYYESFYRVATDEIGNSVVVGQRGASYSSMDLALEKRAENGDLDFSFGNGGRVLIDVGSYDDVGRNLVIQSDLKIVVAGYSAGRIFILRLNQDGSIDQNFGENGKVVIYPEPFDYPVSTNDDIGLKVLADGRIVVAGASWANFATISLNSDGTFDGSFGKFTLEVRGDETSNLLTGSVDDNRIYGFGGSDTLDGSEGADTMFGGVGNDNYYVDSVGDIVTEAADEGTDTVYSYLNSYTLPANVENGRTMSAGSASLTGNSLSNILYAGAGNNILNGGTGTEIDTVSYLYGLIGGSTTGVNVSLSFPTAQATGNSGSDTFVNIENLTGSSLNDTLAGSAGNNFLDGGTGADSLSGGLGNDTYYVDNAGDVVTESSDTVSGGIDTVISSVTRTLGDYQEHLTLAGNAPINGTGNALANTLTGNSAANVLDGGTGEDSLSGDLGNDTYYVDNAGDVVTESSDSVSGGIDTVISSVTRILDSYQEHLTLSGTSAINGTGNTLANTITGNSAANILDGNTGADNLVGGLGNDTYYVDNAGDVVTESSDTVSGGIDTVISSVTRTLGNYQEHLTLSGSAAISGTGNELANKLTGNAASNTLNGGLGSDTLDGGASTDVLVGGDGNDTYYVDVAGDVITETSTGGTDLILSSFLGTYLMGNYVENGQINTTGAANLTGNSLSNILYAGAGNNILNGGLGTEIDTVSYQYGLVSGATLGVTVSLAIATAQSTSRSGSDTLTNIENLTGSSLNDTLIGSASNNILDGAGGIDSMIGGDGSDAYYVRDSGDLVSETNTATTGGSDTVYAYLSTYTLGANVENGRVMVSTAANLTGNTLNNVIYAGAGNNSLVGGDGTDTLSYVYGVTGTTGVTVSLASTTAQTTGGSGSDTISGFENLYGSNNNDSLTGSSGNNMLNGYAGTDTLVGGAGDDTYYVDVAGDVITESSTGGKDLVLSSFLGTYVMGNYVEEGRINTTGAANLTGNSLSNILYAGAGNNILHGGTGTEIDTVSYQYGLVSGATSGVNASLLTGAVTGSTGSDTLTNIENLTGSSLNDTLIGSEVGRQPQSPTG